MARHAGDLSSKEAIELSKQLSEFNGLPSKINLDILRSIEAFIIYNLTEKLCQLDLDSTDTTSVTVEIPLIGELTVSSSTFHNNHALTHKPSHKFSFEFSPTSAFRKGILTAYTDKTCYLPVMLCDKYSKELLDTYKSIL